MREEEEEEGEEEGRRCEGEEEEHKQETEVESRLGVRDPSSKNVPWLTAGCRGDMLSPHIKCPQASLHLLALTRLKVTKNVRPNKVLLKARFASRQGGGQSILSEGYTVHSI